AREHDRVAQALLGVQQDRTSLQRIFSEPERATVAAAVPGHSRSPPPPLVFLKAAAKFAGRQQRQRLVEMRVGVILSQLERLGTPRQRSDVPMEGPQRAAAIVPRLHVIGQTR